jgi:parallel beta-helix repeat protein
MNRTALACTSIATLGLLGAAALVTAGPLDPPAGPVASTHKTLTEVEPRIAINATNTPGDSDSVFKITQPGSYYLTGDVLGVPGKLGIEIAASGVTLDLSGFTLRGVPGSLAGIRLTLDVGGARLRNGNVDGWGDSGVEFLSLSNRSIVEHVVSSKNADHGFTSSNTDLLSCVADNNGQSGFSLGGSELVRIAQCSAASNSNGFSGSGNLQFVSCAAFENDLSGFVANSNASFSGCTSTGNGSSGFFVQGGVSIIDCFASDNAGSGFSATGTNAGGVIRGCTARFNGTNGIAISNGALVEHNTLYQNGIAGVGASVLVTGTDNRIEGNNCTGADSGIEVTGAGNVILRNTCSGNTTNWIIAANNLFGPIIDRSAVPTPAVSGNSGSDATGSPHPNANFTY